MNNDGRLADRIEFSWRQVKRNGREFSVCRSIAFFAALALGHYGLALAAPTGGTITRGNGEIVQQGTRTDIRQGSQRLDIDWTTFSTARNESVNFSQPDRLAVAVNRVIGGVPSHLRGALNANGRVFILNTSGIVFHQSSRVNVGALLATTARDVEVDGDRFAFSGGGQGEVINHGDIRVSDGGFAVLVAPDVTNTGYIQADLGTVALVSGDGFSLDLRGDGLINFKVDGRTVGTVVNTGVVRSRSGRVEISVADAQEAVTGVINLDGVVDAGALAGNDAGVVLVKGGEVNVGGEVRADGPRGGRVSVLGDEINLKGATISASGPAGGGSVLIGGEYQGKGATYTARNTTVDAASRVRADATGNGDGGYVIVWSDGTTTVHGEITARGGPAGGDGGFIETSGKRQLVFSRAADASAPNGAPGTWLLDPENIDIGRGEADAIEDSLNLGNNVSIKTASEGDGEGDISVNASITKSEGDDAALSMDAHGSIDVNAPITSLSGKLDVNMKAGKAVNVNSSIKTNGGSVSTRITGVEQSDQPDTESVVIVDESGSADDDGGDEDADAELADAQGLESTGGEGEPPEEEVDAQAQADAETSRQTQTESSEAIQEELESSIDIVVDDELQPVLRPTFELTSSGSIKTDGGRIDIEAVDGVANIDGVLDASNPAEGASGGEVTVFADEVNLGGNAVVDVSGDAGGGTALIGGDFQGGGDAPTATRTTVAEGAEIRADAVADGDGGTVIVWADGRTEFRGHISARGGAEGGDGGFVEVSGKEQLVYRGMVDTRAPEGRTGTLLLDPDEIFIANGNGGTVDSSAAAVDEGASTAASVTIYEEDLEAQTTGVVLVADRGITLQDLVDDELTMQVDLELRVRGVDNGTSATGFIVFEDLGTGSASASGGLSDSTADRIRVINNDADLVLIGGTNGTGEFNDGSSNRVTITVGHLAAVTHGIDPDDPDPTPSSGSARVEVRAGGDVTIESLRAEAAGERESGSGYTFASAEVVSAASVTVNGDITVAATQILDNDDTSVGADDYQYASAYLRIDAGTHSSGSLTIVGDVDVAATAAFRADADSGFGFYGAEGEAGVFLGAAGDIRVEGGISVVADADASGFTDVYGALALAYLEVAAGEHDSSGALELLGDVLVSADAYHQTNGAELSYLSGALAGAFADLHAGSDITIGLDLPGTASDVDADVTVRATARSEAPSLLPGAPENEGAEGFALAYLRMVAGTHSSGSLEMHGNVTVAADAQLYNAGESDFGDPGHAIAFAWGELYGATGIDHDGDITVTANAVSSGESNGSAWASADLAVQVGGDDPLNDDSHGSSEAGLRLTGNVLISADATYRGDNYGSAWSWAGGEFDATGDIVIDGDIEVYGTSLASGTGDLYTTADNIDDRMMAHWDGSYLADDAYAAAYLSIDAGWHGSGSVDITGDISVEADATLLNGSYAYLEREFGDTGAFASAYAWIGAAADIDIEGDVTVKAKALSSGDHNGDANAFAELEMRAARSPGTDSHSSAALTLTGNVLVSADADYVGYAFGSGEGYARFDAQAAGDITIDGNVEVIANADASGSGVSISSDMTSAEIIEILNYLPPWRFLHIGANDVNATAEVDIAAGTHSGGTFEMTGDMTVEADAILHGGAEGCYDDGLDYLCADVDTPESLARVDITATQDIRFTGDLAMHAVTVSEGLQNNSAVADVYLRLYAGYDGYDGTSEHDNSSASLTFAGNITATADATYEGGEFDGPHGSADADMEVYLLAPGDIEYKNGAIRLTSRTLSTGEDAHYADADIYLKVHAGYDPNGTHDNSSAALTIDGDIEALVDAKYLSGHDSSASAELEVYLLAAGDITVTGDIELTAKAFASTDESDGYVDDATASAHLYIDAGTHSGGALDITGDITVIADGTVVDGDYDEDNAADAGVSLRAANDVRVEGDVTVTAAMDVTDGGEGHVWAHYDVVAGYDHPDHSSAAIQLIGNTLVSGSASRTMDTDESYDSSTFADVWVDLTAPGDITVEGDITVAGVAAATGTGDYGAPLNAWVDAYLYVDAGTHGTGDFAMFGDIDVSADATLKVVEELSSTDPDEADADAFVFINAANDVTIGSADRPGNITVTANALSAGTEENEFGAEGDAFAWAFLRIEAGTNDSDGDLTVVGDTRVEADAEYYGGEGYGYYFAAAEGRADAEAYFLAARNIDVTGDVTVLADGLTSDDGYGDAYGGEGWATLEMDAGLSSSGSLIVRGAIDVQANATAVNQDEDDAVADADALLRAANDIEITGPITVKAVARSVGGTDASAEADLDIIAGDHDSDGRLRIIGDVLVSADADFEGADADWESAWADAAARIRSGDDIIVRGNIMVNADADAVGSEGFSVDAGSATADAYLFIYAGSHSSGTFDMTGNISVLADANVERGYYRADASAGAHVEAANSVFVRGDIEVTALASQTSDDDASATAYLTVLGATHGSDSSQEGDIFVGGDVVVTASAESSDEALAMSRLVMEVAESHEGFNDDLQVTGRTISQAYALQGDGGEGNASAYMSLAAGDDIFADPLVIASDTPDGTAERARCNEAGLTAEPGGLACSDVVDNPFVHYSTAELSIRFHGEFNPEPPPSPVEPPETPVVVTTGGGPVPPVIPPVVPPPGPIDLEVIQRTVESWLAAIAGFPEYVDQLPPGIAAGFTVGPNGEVTFTQSFGDYFKGAYEAGICQYMNCPPDVEDAFGEAAGAGSDLPAGKVQPDLVLRIDGVPPIKGGPG